VRAVRYQGPRQPFQLERVPIPEPGLGEVRVQIRAAGVCHTELHFESGLLNLGVAPLTMGHEIAGVIEELGPGVDEGRKGERVLVYYYAGCAACDWCRNGDENLCGQLQAEYGFFNDGGYAEYIVVPERNAVALPENISFEEAAPIGCGVTTAVHGWNLARVQAKEVVVVYGIGAVGYGLIQVAKHRGARVVGIGRTPRKLELAKELGADLTINASTEEDVAGAILEWTRGRGADVVFELSR
jgi:alcohol dehydrogenase, propanol-preferring